MAKPVSAYVILPLDTSNLGKNIRTQTQVIGGSTVHTHFFVPVSQKTVQGIYYGDPGAVQTIQASAQNGTSTGFWWLACPAASTTNLYVRRVKIAASVAATTVFITIPRIVVALFTFTGTPSGTAITAAKRASADAAAQGYFTSAATGMTITLGAIIHSAVPPTVANTSPGAQTATAQELLVGGDPTTDEGGGIVLAPGEGMVLYQPDAGTASDTRKFDSDLTWLEADNS